MFLVSNETIVEMKVQYYVLDKRHIDEQLLEICNKINSIDGVASYACCQSHLDLEQFPEYGSQFYLAMRASTAEGLAWIKRSYKRFAEPLELIVSNPYGNEHGWVNPRLEIDETCEEHGEERMWSLVIRANIQSPAHAETVWAAMKHAVLDNYFQTPLEVQTDNRNLVNTLKGMATELMVQFNRVTALSEALHNQYMQRTEDKGYECSKPTDANAEELATLSNSLGRRVIEISNLLRPLHPGFKVVIPERVNLTYVSTKLEFIPQV